MNLAEQLISLIAPHNCVVCGKEGALLCGGCEGSALVAPPSRCYRCHTLTKQSAVCASCLSSVRISHVWVSTYYESAAKEIIRRLKFKRARSGAMSIASALDSTLPDLPSDLVVCHIPTANSRVRFRGYDQAALIAGQLSKKRGWRHRAFLLRLGSSRQVGSARKERFIHLEQALKLKRGVDIAGKHILLIDDITTTGATIEAAAGVLKSAGARTIDVAVFAQP